ncbi:MAG: carbon-nitrogen hydrolase [Gammaproteobacteria bacterium]
MTRNLTIATIQHSVKANKQASIDTTIKGIREAAIKGAKVVVLQELHTGPYFCQTADEIHFALAESIPGPSTETFAKIAKELSIVIIGSFFEKRARGIYHNTAVVFDTDGSIAGIYRKMHIPNDPGYYEKYYFTPGDTGFKPIQTSLLKIGVLVCWDQWFPEAARIMALNGAELLVYPTAIGFNPTDPKEIQMAQRDAWMTVQRGHAIANCIPVAVCNRTGFEDDSSKQTAGIDFWGSSFITDAQGQILTEAPIDQEAVITANIDLDQIKKLEGEWPFFRDRRIDAYGKLVKH